MRSGAVNLFINRSSSARALILTRDYWRTLVNTPYEDLIDFVTKRGISRYEAERAVKRCARAMAINGLVAFFLAMNPATAVPYLIAGTAVGAVTTLARAPACSDIREAISYWNTASF